MSEAAEVLAKAARAGKSQILVWGDYDGGRRRRRALCQEVFAWHGITVKTHIPHRTREGYGLNAAMLERLAHEGLDAAHRGLASMTWTP